MNQTQKTYAKKRIVEIKRLALSKIRSMESEKEMTVKEVYEQIKNKKPTRPSKKKGDRLVYSRIHLDEFFDFDYKHRKTEKELSTIEKNKNECINSANKCIDEIMLGDNVKALKMIRDFERKYSK